MADHRRDYNSPVHDLNEDIRGDGNKTYASGQTRRKGIAMPTAVYRNIGNPYCNQVITQGVLSARTTRSPLRTSIQS